MFGMGQSIPRIEDPRLLMGQVEIVQYVAVDDVGDVVNALTLSGQIHGSIVQGAGQALMENIVYTPENGQMLSGSLMDYRMPRADDIFLLL